MRQETGISNNAQLASTPAARATASLSAAFKSTVEMESTVPCKAFVASARDFKANGTSGIGTLVASAQKTFGGHVLHATVPGAMLIPDGHGKHTPLKPAPTRANGVLLPSAAISEDAGAPAKVVAVV